MALFYKSNYHVTDDTPLLSSYLPYDTSNMSEIVSQEEVKIKAVGFFSALKIPVGNIKLRIFTKSTFNSRFLILRV